MCNPMARCYALTKVMVLMIALAVPTHANKLDVGEIAQVYEIPDLLLPPPALGVPPQYLTTAEGISN